MCGRYVLALRYGQVRTVLEENGMPIYEAPDGTALTEDENSDNGNDEIPVDSTFRPTHNFAPGYQGIVCRAVAHDETKREPDSMQKEQAGNNVACLHDVPSQLCYKLQVMKWGLVPSWSKQRPAYSSILKTINCRSDSLARGGMWASMRGRKRCVVVAQGFFEWLKAGPKERVPYYIRRHDGLPLLFAGLWDCLTTGGTDGSPKKKTHTYTIITTDSSKQMQFLHDRMPVIFDLNSPSLRTWLDPSRTEWSEELHSLLRPWPYSVGRASLDIDAVSKDVNKVGHSSPSYVVPVASSANKSNIANFFGPKDKNQKPEARTDTAVMATTAPTKRKFSTLPVVDGLREDTLPAEVDNKPPHKRALVPPFQNARNAKSLSSPVRRTGKKGATGSREAAPIGSQKITSFFGREPTE